MKPLSRERITWLKTVATSLVIGAAAGFLIADRIRTTSPADWPWLSFEQLGGGVMAHLKSRWTDGKIYYTATIAPTSELLIAQRARGGLAGSSFTVQFCDEAGIVLLQSTFYLRYMTDLQDPPGRILRLDYNGQLQAKRGLYASVRSWNMIWSMEP